MSKPGTWQPGQSGNPTGRPKKNRALTEILERAGSKTVALGDKNISGKRLIAMLLWQLATTGKCQLPDGEEIKVIGFDDWFAIVKYIYAQIDGPPKQDIGLEHSGGIDISGYRDELARKLNRIAELSETDEVSGESDG